MKHVLVTNDDGADSPLFRLLLEWLAPRVRLTIAAPASEQSWRGKSMTRHGEIETAEQIIAGQPATLVTGTPADCVNLGLYNLCSAADRPDLVISGINVGLNAGLGLLLASGTVGACLEANIAGLPGLALSQQLDRDTFMQWDRTRAFEAGMFERLRRATNAALERIWSEFVANRPAEPVTWSLNLPFKPSTTGEDPVEIRRARLGHSFYEQCFVATGERRYRHQMQGLAIDTDPRSDLKVLETGVISASRIDIRDLAPALDD
ncbi:MAG: 5'/3'-nucleotidase SurE [Pseudomonadota bacterium]